MQCFQDSHGVITSEEGRLSFFRIGSLFSGKFPEERVLHCVSFKSNDVLT